MIDYEGQGEKERNTLQKIQILQQIFEACPIAYKDFYTNLAKKLAKLCHEQVKIIQNLLLVDERKLEGAYCYAKLSKAVFFCEQASFYFSVYKNNATEPMDEDQEIEEKIDQ